LSPIVADVGDLMGHDQVMLGIDSGLDVVTDHAAPAPARDMDGLNIAPALQRDGNLPGCSLPGGLRWPSAFPNAVGQ
jgi:hypothetical protein